MVTIKTLVCNHTVNQNRVFFSLTKYKLNVFTRQQHKSLIMYMYIHISKEKTIIITEY